ncbi:DUF1202 family protein, partial [Salmonella enterica]
VNAWPDWSALSALSKSKGWDMCHSFLIVYYWNDTEFLTLPNIAVQKLQMQQSDIRVKIMDINDGYERWKKDTDDLRRKEVIK